MGYYITKEDQQEIIKLIKEYLQLSKNGTVKNSQSDAIMHTLFKKYFDKLIMGVIFNSGYKFWRFGELEDLLQEGRLAILLSINKCQYDLKRGTVFNFFSTVIAKNLINYTKKINRKIYEQTTIDINSIQNYVKAKYIQNFDKNFIIDEAFKNLKTFFKGKYKFERLTDLLYHYCELNQGKRFVKKQFIAFAKAYNFSPALVNNYFTYIKHAKLKKEIQIMLGIIE